MKYFRKMVSFVFIFNVILLVFVALSFQVDDMTLSKGEVHDFNTGWEMTWPDGESLLIEELPFLGKSAPREKILFKNTIPQEYFGKTMAFLSADKVLHVWMDDKLVYEFGANDKRSFGHTPGSVYNFIDIPVDLQDGTVKMEMVSPYEHYASRVSSITIGDRDVLILQLLQDNIVPILINLLICVCGIVFFLLLIIQVISKQDTGGMQYLCGYCVVSVLYYFVETKTLHIFYGNQTVYSVMVFVCIMMIPFFIGLYYANGDLGIYKKRWHILLGLNCANILMQMVLQLTGTVDFMNMAVLSHGLIALTVVVVAASYLKRMKEKKDKNTVIGLIALLFMGIGGTIDIVRMYVVAVGDMGKFSRLGSACFVLIMLVQHFSQIIKGYAGNIEENTRLLKNEMEFMEKKNEQLKKANELAEEARQEAIAANAAKGKFLAHMSHEIRTPINAVLGMDTMILRETDDMQIKEYALDIQNAGLNLLSLINDILDFSKIESGKLEIINAEYDFSSLIHDVSNMIQAKVEAKKLDLQIHVDEKIPSKLLGDDVRVRQVLINLLNNAVKYTQEGKVVLNVDGRIEGRKVVLVFAVEDTGIGIKEEDIAKLFKEFERIEEKRNRNIEGTGLGINITTQLLLLMGSRLQVESTYGKGSCFSFVIEQQIVDSTPVGNLEERIREQSTEYTYASTFTAPKAQILVVDDNLINLKVFVSLLKNTLINVDVVDSGKACLEMVASKSYDLIFLDHMMPEMDGIETLHQMKKQKENLSAGCPVVALTANAISGAKEMYLREGFDAYLSKPINPEKLEQMILKLLPRELLLFDMECEDEKEVMVKAQEDSVVKKGERMLHLPTIEGMDWNWASKYLPDEDLLLSTLQDFCKTLQAESDTLSAYYEQIKDNPDMLVQYRIKVHSMKSSANLIGAVVLSNMAKLLEDAAREGNTLLIDALHDIFIKEWIGYKDKLKICVKSTNIDGLSGIQKESAGDNCDINSCFTKLQTALEEFDIDGMDEAMSRLEGIAFPDEIRADIEKLGVFVTNMDCEQAQILIEELKIRMK